MLEAEEVVVYNDVEPYIGFSRLLRVKSKKVLDNRSVLNNTSSFDLIFTINNLFKILENINLLVCG